MAFFGFRENITSSDSIKHLNGSQLPQYQTYQGLYIRERDRIAFLCVYSVLLFMTLAGNSALMAIVIKHRPMRTTANYLLVNMAASDVAAIVVVAPRMLSILITRSKEFDIPGGFGQALCKIGPYVRDVSVAVSIQSMMAIAFDRFFAVVFPMKVKPKILNIRVILPVIWIVALGTFAVYFYIYRIIMAWGLRFCIYVWEPPFEPDSSSKHFYLVCFSLFFVTPLIIITVLYTAISVKMNRQTIPGASSSQSEQRRRNRNRGVLKTSLAIVATFFVCWTPSYTLHIINSFLWNGRIPQHLWPYIGLIFDITIILSYSAFAINPYVCFLFSGNYRNCLKELFPCSLFCKTRVGSLEQSTPGTNTKPLARNQRLLTARARTCDTTAC